MVAIPDMNCPNGSISKYMGTGSNLYVGLGWFTLTWIGTPRTCESVIPLFLSAERCTGIVALYLFCLPSAASLTSALLKTGSNEAPGRRCLSQNGSPLFASASLLTSNNKSLILTLLINVRFLSVPFYPHAMDNADTKAISDRKLAKTTRELKVRNKALLKSGGGGGGGGGGPDGYVNRSNPHATREV